MQKLYSYHPQNEMYVNLASFSVYIRSQSRYGFFMDSDLNLLIFSIEAPFPDGLEGAGVPGDVHHVKKRKKHTQTPVFALSLDGVERYKSIRIKNKT